MKVKKLLVLFLCLTMTLLMAVPSAYAVSTEKANGISIETTLTDGVTLKGSKKTFDVLARLDGSKIASEVTLNGAPVKPSWDDACKTSYTLLFTQEGQNVVEVKASSGSNSAVKSYTLTYEKAEKGELIGYSTWSVEALTIGRGFLAEPQKVPLYEGENAAQVLDRVLTQNGYSYSHTGKLESGFYLAIVADGGKCKKGCTDPAQSKELKIPVNIEQTVPAGLKSVLESEGCWPTDELYDSCCLGEFDYTYMSGWMYAINHVFPNVGFSDSYPSDGDVVRVQFTLFGYGADIGGGYAMGGGDTTDFYTVANKDRLLSLIAGINSDKNKTALLAKSGVQTAYDSAVNAAAQLGASQAEIDEQYEKLYQAVRRIPLTGITLDKTAMTLDKNAQGTVTVQYNEDNTTDSKTVVWTTSDAAVATVDNGTVTAHKAGTAVITAAVGEWSASCVCTVSEYSVNLVSLEDSTSKIKVQASAGVLPADAKLAVQPVVQSDELFTKVTAALNGTAEQFVSYDISLTSEEKTIQPNGKVKVTLAIPAGYAPSRVHVYNIANDGTLTDMQAVVNETTVSFETDHFSLYAVSEIAKATETTTTTTPATTTTTAETKTTAESTTNTDSTVQTTTNSVIQENGTTTGTDTTASDEAVKEETASPATGDTPLFGYGLVAVLLALAVVVTLSRRKMRA